MWRSHAWQFTSEVTVHEGLPIIRDSLIMGSLDEKIVREVRKIAVEGDTTLTGLVREYLERLVAEAAATGRRRQEREALERTFREFHFKTGKRTWTRADLHERS
jgi:hypothetical protein